MNSSCVKCVCVCAALFAIKIYASIAVKVQWVPIFLQISDIASTHHSTFVYICAIEVLFDNIFFFYFKELFQSALIFCRLYAEIYHGLFYF